MLKDGHLRLRFAEKHGHKLRFAEKPFNCIVYAHGALVSFVSFLLSRLRFAEKHLRVMLYQKALCFLLFYEAFFKVVSHVRDKDSTLMVLFWRFWSNL